MYDSMEVWGMEIWVYDNMSVCVYRGIEDLQRQNEKLLAVVRELSEEQESKERETVDIQTKASTTS